jgi:hypothetical protein
VRKSDPQTSSRHSLRGEVFSLGGFEEQACARATGIRRKVGLFAKIVSTYRTLTADRVKIEAHYSCHDVPKCARSEHGQPGLSGLPFSCRRFRRCRRCTSYARSSDATIVWPCANRPTFAVETRRLARWRGLRVRATVIAALKRRRLETALARNGRAIVRPTLVAKFRPNPNRGQRRCIRAATLRERRRK